MQPQPKIHDFDETNTVDSAIAINQLMPGIQLTTIDLMPGLPPLKPTTPFKQGQYF